MTDAELAALLRSALPPADVTPAGDLWPRVLAGAGTTPRWSSLDAGLAAAAAVAILAALAIRPDWLLILAYHL